MKNTRINYKFAKKFDMRKPDNGFNCETEHIVTDGVYDFEDFLRHHGLSFEKDGNYYHILDEDGERTGEVYLVISEEKTNEELFW